MAMSGRSAGLWGEGTQAPSSVALELRVDADYWLQLKPFSSLASKILNSPIIHSQNTIIFSLSTVKSESDFQQSSNPESKYCNAKLISS